MLGCMSMTLEPSEAEQDMNLRVPQLTPRLRTTQMTSTLPKFGGAHKGHVGVQDARLLSPRFTVPVLQQPLQTTLPAITADSDVIAVLATMPSWDDISRPLIVTRCCPGGRAKRWRNRNPWAIDWSGWAWMA